MKIYLLLLFAVQLTSAYVQAYGRILKYVPDCTSYKDGTLLPDHDSCSDYFICINDKAMKQKCPPGYYFDRYASICDLANMVNCDYVYYSENRVRLNPFVGYVPPNMIPNSIFVKKYSYGEDSAINVTPYPNIIQLRELPDITTTCEPKIPDTTTTCKPTVTDTTTTSKIPDTTTTPKIPDTTTTPEIPDTTTTCKPTVPDTTTTPKIPDTTTTPKIPDTTTTCKPIVPDTTTTPKIPDTTTTTKIPDITTTCKPTVPDTRTTQKIPRLEFYRRSSDCSTLDEGTILLDVRHCRRYYVCQRGRARRMRCPLGKWYDSDIRSCRDRRYVSSCAVSRN